MATQLIEYREGAESERALPDMRRSIRTKVRLAVIGAAVLLFGFGGAAAFVPIGGAVIGEGQVGVESRVKRVTHPSGE